MAPRHATASSNNTSVWCSWSVSVMIVSFSGARVTLNRGRWCARALHLLCRERRGVAFMHRTLVAYTSSHSLNPPPHDAYAQDKRL